MINYFTVFQDQPGTSFSYAIFKESDPNQPPFKKNQVLCSMHYYHTFFQIKEGLEIALSDKKLKLRLEGKLKFTRTIPQDYENGSTPLTEDLFERLKEFLLKHNIPLDLDK